MEPRISLITLGVADLERATRFYEECLALPRLKTPPSVTFFELGKTWLALWPRESLAADAGLSPQGSGFPGFSLSHNVLSPAEVDALLARVSAFGAKVVKPAQPICEECIGLCRTVLAEREIAQMHIAASQESSIIP